MSLFPVEPCKLSVTFKRPISLPGKPILKRKASDHGETRFALVRERDGKPFLTGVHTPLEDAS